MLIQSLPHLPLSSRALALGLLLASAACTESEADSLPAALRADLQSSLDAAVANQVTPGASLFVSSGDGETWSTSVGLSDLERNVAMAPNDRFRAGSIMKTLVASAVLQAVEAGTLHLDDVLSERLPARVSARIEHAASIDVGMLLGHRSGIPEWDTSEIDQALALDPEHIWSLDEILDSSHAQPPLFLPGERFSYSNTNYILLGEILSGLDGRNWREVVREGVIARAGLADTSLPDVGDLGCPEPCAHGYLALPGEMLDLTRVDPSMAGASGGHALLTSAADLGRLLRGLRAGALFERPETLDAMFAFQPALDPEMYLTGYGLGVMRLEVDGRTVVGHLGGAPGYQSFMLYAPDTDRYVSGFINVMGDLGAVLVPILQRVTQP